MSLVVRRGTICLGGSDRRAPDRRAGPRRAVRRLVTILRREAVAGVSAALLHFADACCAAGVAIPPATAQRHRRSAWACLNDPVCLMSAADRFPSREVQ